MAAYHKVEVTLNSQAVSVGLPSPQSVRVTLPLVGPQGPVGEAGPVGPEGPQGVPGTGLEVLTTQGDILYQGATTGERLPIGAEGEVLKVESGVPAWGEAGEAYDQSLNTEDSVLFQQVAIQGLAGDGDQVLLTDDQGNLFRASESEQAQESARAGLGLGTAATSDAGDFAAAVHGHVAADISDFATTAAAAAPVSSVAGRTGAITLAVADVSGAVSDTDARLSDSRDPNAHAASHLPEGADEIFDQSLNVADSVDFSQINLGNGEINTSTGNLYYRANENETDTPYIGVELLDENDQRIGEALLGVRGSENGAAFLQGASEDFRIEQDGGVLANLNMANAKLKDAASDHIATIDVQEQLSDDVTLTIPDQSGIIATTDDIPDPSAATPQALGTASAGTSDDYSRGDHIHAAPALNDLSNVSAATPSDNDVLVFDTATSTWVAEAASGGSNMTGATTSAAGTAGLVPAPAAGNTTRALFANADFAEVPIVPPYKSDGSGVWIRSPISETYSQATTGNVTASVRRFVLMYAPTDGTIDLVGIRYTSAPTTGYNVNLSIWQAGDGGTPATHIDGGNIAILSGVGNTEYTLVVNAAIKRGYFWVSFTSDSTSSSGAYAVFNAIASSKTWWLGASTSNTGGAIPSTSFEYTCATSYDQTTHETFSLSTTAAPQIAFQYA
jgi:hypothetical protein